MALSQPDPEEEKKNLLRKAAMQTQNPDALPGKQRHSTLSKIPLLRKLVENY